MSNLNASLPNCMTHEYICDRIAKFHKKLLFITQVIHILTTKYFISNIALHTAVSPQSRLRSHETVYLLTNETPDFITPALWPANSPDLNPVDYQIWGKLQERVYRSHVTSTSWSRAWSKR